MLVVVSGVIFGIKAVLHARSHNKPSVRETPYQPLPATGA
jgi:carbon starvation protein